MDFVESRLRKEAFRRGMGLAEEVVFQNSKITGAIQSSESREIAGTSNIKYNEIQI